MTPKCESAILLACFFICLHLHLCNFDTTSSSSSSSFSSQTTMEAMTITILSLINRLSSNSQNPPLFLSHSRPISLSCSSPSPSSSQNPTIKTKQNQPLYISTRKNYSRNLQQNIPHLQPTRATTVVEPAM